MMKNILQLLPLLLLAVLFSCNATPEGTTIRGELANAANLQVNLDRVQINGPNEMVKNTPIGSDGTFEMNFPNGLKSGIYQMRIGAQRAAFALDGNEGLVTVSGDLTELGAYNFEIEGSESAAEMVGTLRALNEQPRTVADITETVRTAGNPQIGAFIAFNSLNRAGEAGLETHKVAVERLPADDPARKSYGQWVAALESQIAQQKATQRIQVGQPAPNIEMPSPDGQTYALEDLEGQVVLLDFWASWCGPCRRENPNVVKVYDKYKNQGFTIYSVSLDGLDPRRTAGMPADQIAQANEGQKERWVNAINQDNLKWDYHVSDLTKWNSQAAQLYGVRAIPKTFLIDREGKIAAVGLRGASAIESALQEVL